VKLRSMSPREVVHSDPEIMGGGRRCSSGRGLPVETLFDYLEETTLDEFLECFPVTRDQAVAALNLAREAVTAVAYSDR
jgi:uncharacterized protein (DUF433 family)